MIQGVDGHQLVYPVENSHLEYPDISSRTIWDRNKANTCARALTLIQIVWFLIQSIGRWAQHLKLSTFELSTIAFIICTINTFFFFRHKPRDEETAATSMVQRPLSTVIYLSSSASASSSSPSPPTLAAAMPLPLFPYSAPRALPAPTL